MKNLVIYHAGCFDGFAAAYVMQRYFRERGVSDVEYLAAKYGDDPPAVKDADLYVVDFSYPRSVLLQLLETNYVIVLDHHKTAQANCEGLACCVFDMERSGAGLTWDQFFPRQPRPPFVDYIEDRDLWRFRLPYSREISAYIASFPREFETWDAHIAGIGEVSYGSHAEATQGTAILRFERQKVEEMCGEAQWHEIAGHRVPVVNCPYNFGSLCGEWLNQHYPEAPFSAYYFDRGDGEQQWGLRSTGFDVSAVAKQFGGGGHQRAAGFVKGKVTR